MGSCLVVIDDRENCWNWRFNAMDAQMRTLAVYVEDAACQHDPNAQAHVVSYLDDLARYHVPGDQHVAGIGMRYLTARAHET